MLISHKHKFIFIHCRKVAGSSLSVHLSKYMGDDDIQLSSVLDSLSNGIYPNKRYYSDLLNPEPISYLLKKLINLRFRASPLGLINESRKQKYGNYFKNNIPHPTAEEIKNFDNDAWNNYFKFCFVRNPYEKVVSDFHWRVKNRASISFKEFVDLLHNEDYTQDIIPKNFDNWPMYTINDKVCVDFVGRFENLEKDFRTVCTKLKLPFNDLTNSKKITKKYSYKDFYTEEEREKVGKLFKKEIEYFGYKF